MPADPRQLSVWSVSPFLNAEEAAQRHLSKRDSELLLTRHGNRSIRDSVSKTPECRCSFGRLSTDPMFQIHMTWLEEQPSSELQSKPELTDEGSDGGSSCGSIESPLNRSRLSQVARSEDLDGTTSARHWREDERRLASTERRRRSLHGQKSRFCPHAERPSMCREECLLSRPVDSRWEHRPDSSLISIQGSIRAKED